jgi:hypothetical protein
VKTWDLESLVDNSIPTALPNLKKQRTLLTPSQQLNAESAIGLNRVRSQAPQLRLFAIEERRAHTAQA